MITVAEFTVYAPLKHFTGTVVGVQFTDGEGTFDTDNDAGRAAYAYFQRAGYRMEATDPVIVDDPETGGGDGPPVFDPSEHSVDEVMAYLDSASLDEAVRVLDAEAAGKNRVTITGKRDQILADKEGSN